MAWYDDLIGGALGRVGDPDGPAVPGQPTAGGDPQLGTRSPGDPSRPSRSPSEWERIHNRARRGRMSPDNPNGRSPGFLNALHDRQAKRAEWRAGAGERMQGLHSGALDEMRAGETRPEGQSDMARLGEYRDAINDARSGGHQLGNTPGEERTYAGPDPSRFDESARAALDTVRQDFDPYRQAQERYQEARGARQDAFGTPGRGEAQRGVLDARRDMRGERRLAMGAERRGMTQAEYAQNRPQQYARRLSRTGRDRGR